MHLRDLITALPLALLASSGCETLDSTTPSDSPAQSKDDVRDSMGTVMGPISSAIIKLNAGNDDKLGLLARVEVQPNELLEFYEPTPGMILISSAGAPKGNPPLVFNAATSIEELWQRATAGAALPARLQAAIARSTKPLPPPDFVDKVISSDTWGAGQASPPNASSIALTKAPTHAEYQAPLGDAILKDRKAATDVHAQVGWCDSDYFSLGYGASPHPIDGGLPPRFTLDRNDWWNGYWAQSTNTHGYYANVCAASGPVALQVKDSHSNFGDYWIVPTNTVRWVNRVDPSCGNIWHPCFDVRVDVMEAQGDRFHVRYSTE